MYVYVRGLLLLSLLSTYLASGVSCPAHRLRHPTCTPSPLTRLSIDELRTAIQNSETMMMMVTMKGKPIVCPTQVTRRQWPRCSSVRAVAPMDWCRSTTLPRAADARGFLSMPRCERLRTLHITTEVSKRKLRHPYCITYMAVESRKMTPNSTKGGRPQVRNFSITPTLKCSDCRWDLLAYAHQCLQ